MRISILGKITFLAATAAVALSLGACAEGASSNRGATSAGSQSGAATPSTAQTKNFPSALLQTPPNSSVTRSSVEPIAPMYSAIMNVDTTLDQASVFDFYTKTLTEAGFSKVTDRPLADATGISFSRDEEKVDVIFSPSAPAAFSVVASLKASSVA